MAENYPATEKITHTYAISDHGELYLENINGSVDIAAWDKNEISLEAEKRSVDAETLQKIVIKIDATPDRLTIKTEHLRTGWFGSQAKGEVRYTLKVPTGINLPKIAAVNSNIAIHGVRGSMAVRNVNGGIQAEGIARRALIETVNGNVKAGIDELAPDQSLSAKTVNGSCKLIVPSNIAAYLQAETVNGHISCTLPIARDQSRHNKLQGRIGQSPTANIEIKTVNGDITLEAE
jgi:DUF4097 and DUF4098 domain-containing protein YvlB